MIVRAHTVFGLVTGLSKSWVAASQLGLHVLPVSSSRKAGALPKQSGLRTFASGSGGVHSCDVVVIGAG
jgi:hypothetical protein